LSGATIAAIVPGSSPSDQRSVGRTSQVERKRLHDETVAAADRIAAEAHSKVSRSQATAVGALYVRFSTLFQDSAVDQIRELYEFAVEDKIFVPREYVFFDLGVKSALIVFVNYGGATVFRSLQLSSRKRPLRRQSGHGSYVGAESYRCQKNCIHSKM
jgi:hypothetical protein